MREILFRGKTKRNEWIYGDLITHGIDFDDAIKQHHTREVWDIKPESVGQFTGLTDKNGKNIFEGDIVRFRWQRDILTGYVVFDKGHYCIKSNLDYLIFLNSEKEVIGNIHDNPELLGE